MVENKYKLLETSCRVFKILAWISLVFGVLAAIVIFIGGGTPDAPRTSGFIGILLGGLYLFIFYVASEIIKLLLDIKTKLEQKTT